MVALLLSSETSNTSNTSNTSDMKDVEFNPADRLGAARAINGRYPDFGGNPQRERRRTLQTVDELSTQTASLIYRRDVSSTRRKSLPNQAKCVDTQLRNPQVTLSKDGISTLNRSTTDVSNGTHLRSRKSHNDLNNFGGGSVKRRSVNSSLRGRQRSSPLSTVTEGVRADTLISAFPKTTSTSSNVYANHAQNSRAVSEGLERATEGGWNARREKELIKREQAVIAAQLRRERERYGQQGITLGSPVKSPSNSPAPVTGPRQVYARRHSSYEPVTQGFQSTHDSDRLKEPIDRRVSIAHDRVSRRVSIGGIPEAVPRRSELQRAATDPSMNSYTNIPTRTVTPNPKYSWSTSPLITGQDQYAAIPTKRTRSISSPQNLTTRATYTTPSIHSHISGAANATPRLYRHVSSSHMKELPLEAPLRYPLIRSQSTGPLENTINNNPQQTYLKSIPTTKTNEHLPLGGPHQTILPPTTTTMTTTKTTVSHSHQPALSQSSQTSKSSHSTSNSASTTTNTRNTSYTTTPPTTTKSSIMLFAENPDKRGSSPAENKKLALWRAEREKEEDVEEDVKERVKRSNELEGEKGRELVGKREDDARVEKKIKRKRSSVVGLVCGLFKKKGTNGPPS